MSLLRDALKRDDVEAHTTEFGKSPLRMSSDRLKNAYWTACKYGAIKIAKHLENKLQYYVVEGDPTPEEMDEIIKDGFAESLKSTLWIDDDRQEFALCDKWLEERRGLVEERLLQTFGEILSRCHTDGEIHLDNCQKFNAIYLHYPEYLTSREYDAALDNFSKHHPLVVEGDMMYCDFLVQMVTTARRLTIDNLRAIQSCFDGAAKAPATAAITNFITEHVRTHLDDNNISDDIIYDRIRPYLV